MLGKESYLVFCHDFTIQGMCQPCVLLNIVQQMQQFYFDETRKGHVFSQCRLFSFRSFFWMLLAGSDTENIGLFQRLEVAH